MSKSYLILPWIEFRKRIMAMPWECPAGPRQSKLTSSGQLGLPNWNDWLRCWAWCACQQTARGKVSKRCCAWDTLAGNGEDSCEWKLQPGVCIVARRWGDLRNRFNANGIGWEGRRSNDYKCTGEACDCNLIRVQNTTVCYNKDFSTWKTLDEPSCESSLSYII